MKLQRRNLAFSLSLSSFITMSSLVSINKPRVASEDIKKQKHLCLIKVNDEFDITRPEKIPSQYREKATVDLFVIYINFTKGL